jgi:uncharacterized protein
MENRLSVVDMVALVLVLVGGLNWGVVGVFDMNIVEELFGDGTITMVIYALVGLSALYIAAITTKLQKS